jgi:hypothetical protein
MDNRNLISMGALGVMVFFAFGSVSGDVDSEFGEMEDIMKEIAEENAVATPASGTGLAECDAYIERYRCYLNKSGVGTDVADQAEKSYTDSIKQAGALGGDVARKAIAESCTTTADAMKDQFDESGC